MDKGHCDVFGRRRLGPLADDLMIVLRKAVPIRNEAS